MKAKAFFCVVLVIGLSWGAEDLYGVIRGGTIHQFTPQAYGDANWIYFSNGIKFDILKGEPALPRSLTVDRSDYYIVHCQGPVYPEYVKRIESTGARVYSYLPNYAFIVKMDEITRFEVNKIDFVDWIGIYQPAYKISGQEEFKTLTGTRIVTVLLYPDASLDRVCEYIKKRGGKIIDFAETKWDKLINAKIDLSLVPEIARIEEVSWIEPWHKMELHNSSVQWILQTATTNNRRVWDMGIRGDGELLSTCDSGIRTSHYAFRNTPTNWITTWGDYPTHRKVIAYKQAAAVCDFGDESYGGFFHGTHTAGTACGDDSIMANDPRDGVAIKGRIYFVDAGDAAQPGYIILPSNLNTLYNMPYTGNAAGSVKIMSNSWGAAVGGAYTTTSAQSDQFMWDHKDFLLLFSNGNNGPGANTVGAPATAKNVVSVGGCQNGANYQSIYTASSRGPTDDGRYKPTIIAPAQTVSSANGSGDAGYIGGEGTSMASPGAAGAAVLARQYFTDGWYPSGAANPADSIAPSAALIKAVLICSADPSVTGHTAVPNNNIGWGRIDLDSVLYFAGDAKKLSIVDEPTGLSTGQYVEYTYNVVSSAVPFRVALVWTDYPATAGAGKKLINDLHLTVTDPTGNQYKGNVYAGGQSTTGGSYDTLNVEECVRRNSPATGNWTVRISGNNCPYGPQPFAVVVTGNIEVGSVVNVVYHSHTIDDASGNNNGRLDPGETVNITVVLRNDGTLNATNAVGTLRTASTYITLIDSVDNYGTILGGAGTASGTFQFSASAATPSGTVIPMTVYLVANDGAYTTNCNFQITVGLPRSDYVDHNIGNCVLSVTKHGSIGFVDVHTQGSGFIYPKAGSNQLYHATMGLANANNYVMDRFFANTGPTPNNTDWLCTTNPDGRCWIDSVTPTISDQESWAMFSDSGYSAPKSIIVTQHGYAWSAPGYDDFVFVFFEIKNGGSSTVSNLYTGVLADFDMAAYEQNRVGTDQSRRLAYMWNSATPNPYVGVKLLDPYTAANVSALRNSQYVYQGANNVWHDTTFYKFLNGTLSFPSGPTNDDWSVVVSAGPYTLNPGEKKNIVFAFVGGSSQSAIIENADSAQSKYDNEFYGIIEASSAEPIRTNTIFTTYPNPFVKNVCLSFSLAKSGNVKVSIYDVAGKLVKTIFKKECSAGLTNLYWDGRDNSGNILSSGIYFYLVETSEYSKTGKLIILR